MGQRQQPCNKDEEIDLREWLNVLGKWKIVVVSVFVISIFIAMIISSRAPRVYEISTTMRIGSISEPLMKKSEVLWMILSEDFLKSVLQTLKIEMPVSLLKQTVEAEEIANTDFIKIKIRNQDPELGKRLDLAIANALVVEGQALYKKKMAYLEGEFKKFDGINTVIEERMSELNSTTSTMPLDLNYLSLQDTLSGYAPAHIELLTKMFVIKDYLAFSKDFAILESPFISRLPVALNRVRNIGAAAVIGLIVSVMTAFGLEFISKGREL
jgi:capsular polysaccharide biosynthesis protein